MAADSGDGAYRLDRSEDSCSPSVADLIHLLWSSEFKDVKPKVAARAKAAPKKPTYIESDDDEGEDRLSLLLPLPESS